ncbi:MAG: hypothetical protein AABY06_01500 [Nanoarchaeota archaeon]
MEISEKNKQRISEQILAYLYSISPKAVFTIQIAKELVRDEEFVKQLLINLKKKEFVIDIKKNSKGIPYLKRRRWKLSDKAYSAYKMSQ